jgi:hypothetical protein
VDEKRWHIREYRPGDEERIVPFFNEVFGEYEGFQPRSLDFWEWQFAQNPFGHRTLIAEDDGGALVGNYAGIRVPFLFRGERRIGAQIVDTCARKDFRGSGFFIDLASAYYSRYADPDEDLLAFGYPNPPAFRVGTRHLGYTPIHCPIFAQARTVDRAWLDDLSRNDGSLEVREVQLLDGRVDGLWRRVQREHEFGTWRDLEYLHWRYETHPTIRYRFLYASDRSGELQGLLVARLGDPFGGSVLSLVDFVGPRTDRSILVALVGAAGRIALGGGLATLEAWFPPGCPERGTLASLGFSDKQVPFNLVVRLTHDRVAVDWLKEHWFYTMGDTDFY